MIDYILALARHIEQAIRVNQLKLRYNCESADTVFPGREPLFALDELAEWAIRDFVESERIPMAISMEGSKLEVFGDSPEHLLVVDPIDGTRPSTVNLEMACISIAAAPYRQGVTLGDIEHAVMLELKSGAMMYASRAQRDIQSEGYPLQPPQVAETTTLEDMFWSFEPNGHPARYMMSAYGNIIDASAKTGGVFLFNSASFSISRIISGQLDAYVDVRNRLLRDKPMLEGEFRRVGNGNILHLFPYDIAASVLLAKKAGIIVTDAYGHSLDDTLLLDFSPMNQQSCIAACTHTLHNELLSSIQWDFN